MKELVLLVGGRHIPPDSPEARLVVYWNDWDAPGGLSLPARLASDFERIRAEHAAWAYETGLYRVGGKQVREHLSAGKPLSLWWCSLLYERHPKMTPGLYTVYRLRSLELLMDAENVTDVRLVGDEGRLRRSLEELCAVSGRRLHAGQPPDGQGRPGPNKRRLIARVYRVIPAPLRALVRYAHWWWTVRRKLPFAGNAPLPRDQGKSATIVTYFPNIDTEAARKGRFRSRYFESLHNALDAKELCWLFIRFPAPDIPLDRCIALRDRFREQQQDGISFHYLEEFLSFADVLAALSRWARLVVASLRLERQAGKIFSFAGSRLNFWPILGQYWAESFRGWRCLERCLQYQAFLRWTRLAGPQRWTLFPLENCPWERMLAHAVHCAGNGPVYGAQHSALRPTDLRYFDDPRTFDDPECALFQPDALRANGRGALIQWLGAGVPPERLGMVEALRYLYLMEGAPKAENTPRTPRLLVVTSFFPDETDGHLALLAKALTAGLLAGFDVVVKPHPYLPVRERLRLLLGEAAEKIREVRGAMAEHLQPGVIVWASNSTTATLEAAASGLPVMVMPPPKGDFDLCPLQDMPQLLRTATLEDVRQGLTSPEPLALPPDYFALDPTLPRWREWLGLARRSPGFMP
ncbi:MAG: hypothetical protein LBB60_10000 [Desulfovibrio sp.]|jgi:surface carbohydrate biosynthesis protein (TIGR04326 family)|nr:hypothetical protein [Desulfovibrio sp.]